MISRGPSMASTEGPWDLIDSRTGKLLTAGSETQSGVPVSAESALGLHTWYRAHKLLSSKAACVPKYVYKPAANKKGKTPADGHVAQPLIGTQANEEQTAFQFWLQMTGHVCTRGNGYAVIFRDSENGPPLEFIPVDPDKTHPVMEGNRLWYVVFPFGADDKEKKGRKILAKDMLHFRDWGFDGLVGYPVWKIAANEIGLGKGERQLASSRFRNSGRPSVILTTDKNLPVKTKNRIRDEWQDMHTGADNAFKTAILDHGLKATPFALDATELQQSEAAQMSIIAISNYTGVPVTKLGGGRPFATQEQEDRAFVNDGLAFYLDMQDDQLNEKLLTKEERRQGYHIRSDREVLLTADIKGQFEAMRIATGGKPFFTQNEARDRFDMPPDPDPESNELGTPLNMGQGGINNEPRDNNDDRAGRPRESGKIAAKNPQGEDMNADLVKDAARTQIGHLTTRLTKRLGMQAVEAAAGGARKFGSFLTAAKGNHLAAFKAELSAMARMVCAITGDATVSDMGTWLFLRLMRDYEELEETATEKTIAAETVKVFERQKLTIAQLAIDIYLPTEEG